MKDYIKKLEKIIVAGSFVAGLSLFGIGFYRDNKSSEDYVKNIVIKGAGLISLIVASGISFGKSVEEEDKEYIEKHNGVYPR